MTSIIEIYAENQAEKAAAQAAEKAHEKDRRWRSFSNSNYFPL